jgi:uncharacterized protein YggE
MKNVAIVALLVAPLLAFADDSAALRRSVAVTGEGEVSAAPDRARLSMSVDALAPEVKAAQDQVNKVVRAYVAEAKSLGVKDEDLSTAGMTLSPEYVWDEKLRNNRLTGYRARRNIEVVVRNLDQVGQYLLGATKAGINNVSPPSLESSHKDDLERQALVKAAQDARARADLLATTLGAKLGPVHSLNAAQNSAPPPYPMVRAMAMAGKAADGNEEMGFEAGEIKFNATVNADFDLVIP